MPDPHQKKKTGGVDDGHMSLETDGGSFADDSTMNVVSGTDCTGMVPSAPLDDGEADAYRLIGDMPVTTEKYLFDRGQKRP